MQKLNVKATKLRSGDIIEIGGIKHRVYNLTLHFGRQMCDKISMSTRSLEDPSHLSNLSVCPKARFNVKRPNKK